MTSSSTEKIQISQNPEGYRYSVEPFLLADWVRPAKKSRILDIGTGCGVISLLLMSRHEDLEITGVEIQNTLYQSAVENVRANGWSDRIRVLEGDFQSVAGELEPESFDWIISNPPYRKANSGKINPCREKALARHELALTLEALVMLSAPLLKPEGRIALAYPHYRLEEVMDQLRRHGLNPARYVRVLGHDLVAPKICLVEAVKGLNLPVVEETLTIYHPDGSYTQTMKDIYASFNYPERSHRLR
ncbi:MAG: methyltransferase [Nitrospinota bacterium]|nr:methyltransferase [Nitrospinota bacterium]